MTTLVGAQGRVVTLGKFDGVHRGHQAIAGAATAMAQELGVKSTALVLHPDPRTVLLGQRVEVLATPAERCHLLRGYGLDEADVLPFTKSLSELSPGDFLASLGTQRGVQLLGMVVGEDFRFGHGRAGTALTLRDFGRSRGFRVTVVPPLVDDGEPISSGRVRRHLNLGQVLEAARLLGRPYRIRGTVVHGAARGRELGFPTANLDLTADFVVPENGIYTIRADWDGAPRPMDGLASIGVRPTFDNGARVTEVYLLDFNGDLYGRELRVDFIAYQRPEQRFDAIPSLIDQMNRDVLVARENLARADL